MGDWRLHTTGRFRLVKREPTDDGDIVKVSDEENRVSAEGRLSRFCEKVYVLEEEVGTKGIGGEEEGDGYRKSDISFGDSEEDDCNEDYVAD